MKKLVVFSGAGISAESGLKTFRDTGGLWEEYNVYDVATPEAFRKDPDHVLSFYNMRRRQLASVEPNKAHLCVASLEAQFDVCVVTQNVDDLHERAGSSRVLHLHGELRKVRSVNDPKLNKDIEYDEIHLGDLAEDGGQWRPDIVWFGEQVPMMDKAIEVVQKADLLIIIGTSLNVYPAAGLVSVSKRDCQKFLIDPNADEIHSDDDVYVINEKAGTGMSRLLEILLSET